MSCDELSIPHNGAIWRRHSEKPIVVSSTFFIPRHGRTMLPPARDDGRIRGLDARAGGGSGSSVLYRSSDFPRAEAVPACPFFGPAPHRSSFGADVLGRRAER